MTAPIRAAAYRRVSTEGQESGTSLDGQRAAILRYAVDRGLEIVADFEDVQSGATTDRPGLDALLAAARRGQFQAVVIYHLDRLSRDVRGALNLLYELHQAGVAVHDTTSGEIPESTDPMTLMRLWFAGEERRTIARRMQKGLRDKVVIRKMPHGIGRHPPYGYRWVYDGNAGLGRVKRLEINPDTASVVREVYRLYLTGESLRQISLILTARGIPTARDLGDAPPTGTRRANAPPGTWSVSMIQKIVTSPLYRGEHVQFAHTDRAVSVPAPAIVDDDTWEAAQRRARENTINSPRNRRHFYLLGRRVRCECGYVMSGQSSRGGGARYYVYYRCSGAPTSQGQRPCSTPTPARGRALESAVWLWLVDQLTPARLVAGLETERAEAADRVASQQARLSDIQRQQDEIAARQTRIKTAYVAGVFSLDEFSAEKLKLDTAAQVLADDLAALQAEMDAGVDDQELDALLAEAEQLQGFARGLDDDQAKRKLIDMLDVRVVVALDRKTATVSARLGLGGSVQIGVSSDHDMHTYSKPNSRLARPRALT